jgi:hypothetical protein
MFHSRTFVQKPFFTISQSLFLERERNVLVQKYTNTFSRAYCSKVIDKNLIIDDEM